MSSFAMLTFFPARHYTKLSVCVNKFHTSFTIYLDQRWRSMKGLEENPNNNRALLNLPDYSFEDKRPTAYGSKQMQRIKKHQNFVRRIVKLVGEVDYAVERHAKLLKEKEEEKQKILDSKLKPKGQKFITSN